jgi:hypothetical protein
MEPIELSLYQEKAIADLKNGSVLYAKVGTGKSRTALAYFYTRECGGSIPVLREDGSIHGVYKPVQTPKDLYIITTAKKRDDLEWEIEASLFGICDVSGISEGFIKIKVDSWNNVKKYCDVSNAFFIFDEQRVVGSGKWSKSFLKIAAKNHWILLTATPGDTWTDYVTLFIANGYFKNKTEFNRRHVVYSPYVTKYPKIEGYVNEGRLIRYRNDILVPMVREKKTHRNDVPVIVGYDRKLMKDVLRTRWNVYKDEPIRDAAQLCYIMRRVANSSEERVNKVRELISANRKVIVFYNFDYELEILRKVADELGIEHTEWNGHRHQDIPVGDRWVYLVQYTAGAEGWNCVETNVIVFYSQNYSYKTMEQAAGRIDRMNTPFDELYYYRIRSSSGIDIAIAKALENKKNFNESRYMEREFNRNQQEKQPC